MATVWVCRWEMTSPLQIQFDRGADRLEGERDPLLLVRGWPPEPFELDLAELSAIILEEPPASSDAGWWITYRSIKGDQWGHPLDADTARDLYLALLDRCHDMASPSDAATPATDAGRPVLRWSRVTLYSAGIALELVLLTQVLIR